MEASKVLVAFVLSLAVAAPLAMPALAAPTDASVLDRIARELAQQGAETGVETQWTPGGPMTRTITRSDFLEIAAGILGPIAVERFSEEDAPPPSASAIGCGFAVGSPLNNAAAPCSNAQWQFCDVATVFVFHFGEAGASISSDAALPAAPPPSVCDGAYGQTLTRVTSFDGSSVAPLVQCAAAEVWLTGGPYSSTVGTNGGYKCTTGLGVGVPWTTATVVGTGALYSVNFGIFTIDAVLGAANVVTLQ